MAVGTVDTGHARRAAIQTAQQVAHQTWSMGTQDLVHQT